MKKVNGWKLGQGDREIIEQEEATRVVEPGTLSGVEVGTVTLKVDETAGIISGFGGPDAAYRKYALRVGGAAWFYHGEGNEDRDSGFGMMSEAQLNEYIAMMKDMQSGKKDADGQLLVDPKDMVVELALYPENKPGDKQLTKVLLFPGDADLSTLPEDVVVIDNLDVEYYQSGTLIDGMTGREAILMNAELQRLSYGRISDSGYAFEASIDPQGQTLVVKIGMDYLFEGGRLIKWLLILQSVSCLM